MGKSSPTSGKGASEDVTNRTTPDPRALRRDVVIDGQTVSVKGPKAALSHIVAAPITVERDEDAHAEGPAAQRRASEPRPAWAVADADRRHDHRRHRGVHQDPRDRRCRLPRAGARLDLEFALGFSHPVPVKAPEGVAFAVESPTRLRSPGSTSSRWGSSPPDPQIRRPDPYKGKGVRYRGSSSARSGRRQVMAAAKTGRPAARRHRHQAPRRVGGCAARPPAQARLRYARAPAPRRQPPARGTIHVRLVETPPAARWPAPRPCDAACVVATATSPPWPAGRRLIAAAKAAGVRIVLGLAPSRIAALADGPRGWAGLLMTAPTRPAVERDLMQDHSDAAAARRRRRR